MTQRIERNTTFLQSIVSAFILLGFFTPKAYAATLVVAKDGSGDYTTIAAAYALANPGDVVLVRPGVYDEFKPQYGIYLNRHGEPNKPITLRSERPWQAVIDSGQEPDSAHGFWMSGNYNTIEGFDIRNQETAINVWSSYNRIVGNHVHDNRGQGVYSAPYTRGSEYINNYFHHNGSVDNLDHALYLCDDDVLVANNVITHSKAYGLQIAGYSTVSNMRIYNNVFAYNGKSGAILWKDLDEVAFRNNIFYKNALWGIASYAAHGTGVVFDHNIFFGNPQGLIDTTTSSSEPTRSDFAYTRLKEIVEDPRFINETSDYRLSQGSPAIDSGIALSDLEEDMTGVLRPQGLGYDIGAFEFTDDIPAVSPPVEIEPTELDPAQSSLVSSNTLTASSENFHPTHGPDHLWDLCLESTPECTSGSNAIASFWLEFDFGSLHHLSSTRLLGDANGVWVSSSWSLHYKSSPSDTWIAAFVDKTALFSDWSIQDLDVSARFVRVEVNGNASGEGTQARELEIHGVPIVSPPKDETCNEGNNCDDNTEPTGPDNSSNVGCPENHIAVNPNDVDPYEFPVVVNDADGNSLTCARVDGDLDAIGCQNSAGLGVLELLLLLSRLLMACRRFARRGTI
ncbi:MAG: right-handed parallel beta-helix repeat-containing protein [Myxococcota bacterium]